MKWVNGLSGLVQVKSDPSHLIIGYTGIRVNGYGPEQPFPYPLNRVGSGSGPDTLTGLVLIGTKLAPRQRVSVTRKPSRVPCEPKIVSVKAMWIAKYTLPLSN